MNQTPQPPRKRPAGKLAGEGKAAGRMVSGGSTPGGTGKIGLAVANLLTRRNRTLATAESCTGGLIANQITNVPGASKIFPGRNCRLQQRGEEKISRCPGQNPGAAWRGERAVAREMAEGARKRFGVDFALAVTGIAGPGGGMKTQAGGDGLHRAGGRRRNAGRAEVEFLRARTIQASHGKSGIENALFAA